jgi:hypothetical protein
MVGAVVAWGGAAWGQLPPPPDPSSETRTPQPRLFVGQRVVELGDMIEGEVRQVSWRLENEGDAPLVIDRAQPGCGCTVVDLPESDKTIPPGGSIVVRAHFNSAGRDDEQNRGIKVFSNDPAEPELQLTLHANVKRLLEMSPATGRLVVRSAQRGTRARYTLDLLPTDPGASIAVTSIDQDPESPFRLADEGFVDDRTRLRGRRVFCTVRDDAPLGPASTVATLKLKIADREIEKEIVVSGTVIGELTYHPHVLNTVQNTSRRGQKLPRVRVSSAGESPFEITEVDAGSMFESSVEAVGRRVPELEYEITLTVAATALPGPFGEMLRIRTSSFDQPLIEIPVFGMVAPIIDVEPAVVLLRQDGTAVGSRRRVRLMAPPRETLSITGIECDNPAIRASVDEDAEPQYKHIVSLIVELWRGDPAGGLPAGRHRATLTVRTTIPDAEKVEIPVTVFVSGS